VSWRSEATRREKNRREKKGVFHPRQLGEENETLEQAGAEAIDVNRSHMALIGIFVPEVE
jgi:hypothetical protein